MWPQPDFAEFSRQIEPLRSKPVEKLSPTEAEAYFVLLSQIASRVMMERGKLERILAATLENRQHGALIAQRFRDESFVRCAFLASEARIANRVGLQERFSQAERKKARDDYLAFIESALRGEVPTDTYRDVLQSYVGQSYFDRGFEVLPDTAKAAPLFEIGARHVFDAASNPTDERYLGNWRRYAGMLDDLPLPRQIEIANRLLTYMENTWGGKSARTPQALEVYLHLLDFAGQASLAAKQGKDAVSIFGRHLEVVQHLRRRDPGNPNHQVNEALGYLLVGDARALNGDAGGAARAYQDAQRVFESSNAAAKNMLRLQEFSKELSSRRRVLR